MLDITYDLANVFGMLGDDPNGGEATNENDNDDPIDVYEAAGLSSGDTMEGFIHTGYD